ncbi:MAG: hypothetical protein IJ418_14385, partial [Clostridia bacterium]|nr:hypothetical protein [Clostridia bacterium]
CPWVHYSAADRFSLSFQSAKKEESSPTFDKLSSYLYMQFFVLYARSDEGGRGLVPERVLGRQP